MTDTRGTTPSPSHPPASPNTTTDDITNKYERLRADRRAGRGVHFEQQVRKAYEAWLIPGDHAADVGAHDMAHTLPMLDAVSPGGSVHAFEPIPALFDRLRTRADAERAAGRQLIARDEATSDHPGNAEFVVVDNDLGYSGLREREYDRPDPILRRIPVTVVRLDDALPRDRRYSLFKLDIEGGEWDAIRGAAAIITADRPLVLFEFGERSFARYGVDVGAVFNFFNSRGYVLHDIAGTALPTADVFAHAVRTPGLWDFAAIPSGDPRGARVVRAIHIH